MQQANKIKRQIAKSHYLDWIRYSPTFGNNITIYRHKDRLIVRKWFRDLTILRFRLHHIKRGM
jgi:hypothetical protein